MIRGFLLALALAGSAQAAELPLTGTTKIEHEFVPKLELEPGQELVVAGTNPTNLPAHLTLRADDGKSAGYDSRIDEEHLVPPGPFTLRSPLSGWKTPSGRMLDLTDIRRIILFTEDGQGPLSVTRVAAGPPVAAAGAAPGPAEPLPLTGVTKIEHEFAPKLQLDPRQELVVSGSNPTNLPVHLVLRADDGKSAGFDSRIGEEHLVPPGPFTFRSLLSGWKTPSGRLLDLGDVRRIILFTASGEGPLTVTAATVGAPGAAVASVTAPAAPPLAALPDRTVLPISGTTTLAHEFSPPLRLDRRQEVSIIGENRSTEPITLTIRVDDEQSRDYAGRLDEERVVPPGRFHIRTSPGQWKTPSGRLVDLTAITQIILFTNTGSLDIASVAVERGFVLPAGAIGWKLGPGGSAVFPGFEPVLPGDPRLTGTAQRAIDRPSGDGLIGSGIRGVDRFQVPLANGRWRITLWTEDVGEWEYLPHELDRQIRVNGKLAHSAHFTPEQWVRQIYLAGRDAEALADGDPWAVFGRRRGGLVQVEIEVTDGALTIEQQGDGPEARFLSAVLAEPAGRTAFEAVEAARRERFLDRWPVLPFTRPEPYAGPLVLGVLAEGAEPSPAWRPGAASAPAVVARDGIASIDVMALAAEDRGPVKVEVRPPSLDGQPLSTPELRWGQWSYMRRVVASPALGVNADRLRGDLPALTLRGGLPRRLNLLFTVPDTAMPGVYRGRITLEAGGETASQVFALEVLPVTLPPPDRPIGLYLSEPPWYDWFGTSDGERDRAMGCDLSFLSRLGLSGLAPDFVTPTPDHLRRFADQLAVLRDGGFTMPILAYRPVHDLIAATSIDGITAPLAALDRILAERGLAMPVWNIADEPGNPGSMPDDLAAIRRNLLLAMPRAQIAGHLNGKEDRLLLPLFEVPLINPGFGVDADEIHALQAKGIHPWLYNMPDLELAAGFFLWRSGAGGYVQWHGRLPTADPFDPTDGREGDIMFLPVTAQSCLAVPDVDALLLRFARGIDDLRWMSWLEGRAGRDENAALLLARIRGAVPSSWSLDDHPKLDLPAIRRDLAAYARTMR